MKKCILIFFALCVPGFAFGEGVDFSAQDAALAKANKEYEDTVNKLIEQYSKYLDNDTIKAAIDKRDQSIVTASDKIKDAKNGVTSGEESEESDPNNKKPDETKPDDAVPPQTGADVEKENEKYFDQTRADDLKQKAAEAKAREQSTANKLIGAAAIGAAGIGGMNYFQGAAEKKADEDSAADIAAYLSTITCEISGRGGKIRRGETGAAPGFSNPARAVELKSEYIRIADKTRSAKENLGMPAGIESELIVDKSSLYDYGENGAGGKTANRFDTAQERLDSGEAASKMKTGATTALVGIGVGLVGNLAVNEIFPKLGQGDIEKYGGKKQENVTQEKFKTTYKNAQNVYNAECTGDYVKRTECVQLNQSLKEYK
ncbi:MAG: hypothetical protein LBK26_03335 [Rickettsiales bacterium]|jgi:hypothetical protein|nr:hypothetical protein [Rickettsiales bacterium]